MLTKIIEMLANWYDRATAKDFLHVDAGSKLKFPEQPEIVAGEIVYSLRGELPIDISLVDKAGYFKKRLYCYMYTSLRLVVGLNSSKVSGCFVFLPHKSSLQQNQEGWHVEFYVSGSNYPLLYCTHNDSLTADIARAINAVLKQNKKARDELQEAVKNSAFQKDEIEAFEVRLLEQKQKTKNPFSNSLEHNPQ